MARLPSPQIRDACCVDVSPFFLIRNWTIAIFNIVSTINWTQNFRNYTHFRNRTKTSIVIFSYIEHISHKYPIKVIFSHIEHISHKYPLKVKIFTQIVIFWHIEHILHNYFAIFHWGLGFFKFLTFSWWLLCKYGTLLADGTLGLIIEVTKGGISSNWSNSSSSMAFLTPTIHHFSGITTLSLLFVVFGT
jgi:hypothetical protein